MIRAIPLSARTVGPASPAGVVVVDIDDNLVLAHETLGRLWARDGERWPANENRRAFSGCPVGHPD